MRYTIKKKYAAELLDKEQTFIANTKTRKAIFTFIISPYRVVENEYKTQSVQIAITMDALFKKAFK